MSYLPSGTPLPQSSPEDAEYWAFINDRQLRIQRCAECGRFRHPPMPNCPSCRSAKVEWAPAPETGTVFTYTVVRHSAYPALNAAVPYNVAVVMLDGPDDIRIVSNVIDASPDEIRVGMPVSLVWEPTEEGGWLPRFRKAEAKA